MEKNKEQEMIDFTMNEEQLNNVIYIKDENGVIIEVIKKNEINDPSYVNENKTYQFLKD